MVELLRHRQTKGAGTDRFYLTPPRHISTLPDCIWYGSPQDQIQAFRAFQISEELQEKHGYPKMTPKRRAQIFGLNAARPYGIDIAEVLKRAGRDKIERRRAEYRSNPDPHFLTFGPKDRREFFANLKARGGVPI